jgi:NADPH:quinone reductase-like Zn-dependent oxidoreductase
MKAIVRSTYGPPEVLQVKELEKPAPKDHEVLIRVYATTVNRTDCANLWGKPFVVRFFTSLFKPTSPVPGTDFAGEIEAVGKNVTTFKTGDKVWGFDDNGLRSHAQYMTLSADSALTTIPAHITYEQAAASAEGAHYAYNFINKVNLRSGHTVLVNGASGAIGSAAVQLLKYFDAQVTAVCNTKNIELIQSLGVGRIIDYTKEDFTKDKEKYDFVFDTVGKSSFAQCKPILKPGGIYISSELGPRWQNVYLPLITRITGDKKVIFPVPTDKKGSMLFIRKLMEQGKFKAVIDRTYLPEQAAEAYRYVASGQKTGNVILTF